MQRFIYLISPLILILGYLCLFVGCGNGDTAEEGQFGDPAACQENAAPRIEGWSVLAGGEEFFPIDGEVSFSGDAVMLVDLHDSDGNLGDGRILFSPFLGANEFWDLPGNFGGSGTFEFALPQLLEGEYDFSMTVFDFCSTSSDSVEGVLRFE
jgi:hypothetical protein